MRRSPRTTEVKGTIPRITSAGFAWRQVWRRPVRSSLTMFGIALSVAVLLSLIGFAAGYREALDRDIENLGFDLLVTSKGCPYEAATLLLRGGKIPMYIQEDVYGQIVNDPLVGEITKLFLQTMPGDPAAGEPPLTLVMGVERSLMKLKPWLDFQQGGWFSDPDADEAILGYNVATEMHKSIGDSIDVGDHRRRPFRVVGILDRVGAQEDGTIFLPLRSAQYLFDQQNRLTGIGIKLRELYDLDRFIKKIFALPGVQVITLAQVRGTILNLVESARVIVLAVSVVAIIVALVGVMNSILMSLFERTRELGVLKAMGASSWDLFRFIWIETLLQCTIGGVAGIGLAWLLSGAVEKVITGRLQYAPSGRLVEISPSLMGQTIFGVILAGLLAGFYPAWRASRVRPMEAIRGAE